MAEPLLLAAYHDAVLSSLRKLSWVKDAETYPENVTPLTTPAVYFSLEGWEPGATCDGQLNVVLNASLYMVIDRSSATEKKPDIYARAAAADVSQWIEGQQFGLTHIEPAIFTGAAEDNFDPRLDAYLVWRVSYQQSVAFGPDPFAVTAAPLSKALLSRAPQVGEQHVGDYRLIYQTDCCEEEDNGTAGR
ncbi:hypothetical protein SC206_18345 [Rouxiella sp. T17]|uniref:hypothetical protein n=1 Tax=Rouxiella sp. T17 TaxID=3085684 RepID=UPI002FC728D5